MYIFFVFIVWFISLLPVQYVCTAVWHIMKIKCSLVEFWFVATRREDQDSHSTQFHIGNILPVATRSEPAINHSYYDASSLLEFSACGRVIVIIEGNKMMFRWCWAPFPKYSIMTCYLCLDSWCQYIILFSDLVELSRWDSTLNENYEMSKNLHVKSIHFKSKLHVTVFFLVELTCKV